MREVVSKDPAEPKVRKHVRSYKVTWLTADGSDKKTFEHLSTARQFALTKIGQDVKITNKNGIDIAI